MEKPNVLEEKSEDISKGGTRRGVVPQRGLNFPGLMTLGWPVLLLCGSSQSVCPSAP